MKMRVVWEWSGPGDRRYRLVAGEDEYADSLFFVETNGCDAMGIEKWDQVSIGDPNEHVRELFANLAQRNGRLANVEDIALRLAAIPDEAWDEARDKNDEREAWHAIAEALMTMPIEKVKAP